MRTLPIANPPNPYHLTSVEYEGQSPQAEWQVFEDSTKNILAKNDSPDIGFTFSVNPYRGCMHGCAYCLAGDTPILMADGRARPLSELAVGDEIVGTRRAGSYRRYVTTTVLDHWSTLKPAYRVRLEDGTELVTSADHRFLSRRGWKYVVGAEQGRARRPHLTIGARLMGTGRLTTAPVHDEPYRRGYLAGMIRADGTVRRYEYHRRGRPDVQHHFRLALTDDEGISRTREFLAGFGVATRDFVFVRASDGRQAMSAIRTHAEAGVRTVSELIAWPVELDDSWCRGFLAGIFDAEGSFSDHTIRIANQNDEIIEHTTKSLGRLGFDHVVEASRLRAPMRYVRIRGGLRAHVRFFLSTDPAISRKRRVQGTALKSDAPTRVVSVEPLGLELPLYDITTGTGDFIADGIVSHNCYARPSHEYLGFGAGTDFETKIVVKPEAPALLRAAFDKPSWKGERVIFSGVTDCYQPLESTWKLTRGCLEVCAEYMNPVGVITKAPLVERDADLLAKLGARVTISIPFFDPEKARALEPYVATPARRLRTIERLAAAGVNVGVNVAPVIPGLTDEDIPDILGAARAAGATHAGFVMLRLPGPVAAVFEDRVRAAFPLRADKILNRVRDTRGGKLYDSRFGERMRGEGEYANIIQAIFDAHLKKFGYPDFDWMAPPGPTTFRRPPRGGQLSLF